jgi:hypothetical protein
LPADLVESVDAWVVILILVVAVREEWIQPILKATREWVVQTHKDCRYRPKHVRVKDRDGNTVGEASTED